MSGSSRLLEQVREVIRIKHYSIRTEQAYLQWIRRYILFHGKRHPSELGADHLSTFLSDLAVRGHVAASTQNQALHAILFLYREVLKQTLPWIEGIQRAKQPQHLPVVLSRTEIKHVLAQLEGTSAMSQKVTGASIYPSRSIASTRTRTASGDGSTSSPPRADQSTHARA